MLGGGLDELYREVILDHSKNPRNYRELPAPDVCVKGHNPLCGDQIILELKISGGTVEAAGFHGSGCAISQASASMLTDSIKGKSLEEAERLIQQVKGMVMGTGPTVSDGNGDLEALEGVKKFPVRVKCATLCWNTLQQAILTYRAGGHVAEQVEK
ncbi:MAG: SUF system NifU family Fe-S cluster assembly protein [Chloroflexi bacterium]|nr:SUF system NifU family Fe-S cluster assembly protein [Chloroflexota bacterium]